MYHEAQVGQFQYSFTPIVHVVLIRMY